MVCVMDFDCVGCVVDLIVEELQCFCFELVFELEFDFVKCSLFDLLLLFFEMFEVVVGCFVEDLLLECFYCYWNDYSEWI